MLNVNNALAHERRFSGLKNDSVGWPPKPRVAGEDQQRSPIHPFTLKSHIRFQQ